MCFCGNFKALSHQLKLERNGKHQKRNDAATTYSKGSFYVCHAMCTKPDALNTCPQHSVATHHKRQYLYCTRKDNGDDAYAAKARKRN